MITNKLRVEVKGYRAGIPTCHSAFKDGVRWQTHIPELEGTEPATCRIHINLCSARLASGCSLTLVEL